MNKRNLTITVLLACMLVGTMAFAETSLRIGGNYITLNDESEAEFKDTGYELYGKIWFEEAPKLTLSGSYTDLERSKVVEEVSEKDSTLKEIAATAEYKVYNEDQFGLALTGGWLGTEKVQVEKEPVDDGTGAEAEATEGEETEPVADNKANYLTVGGKATLGLSEGLYVVGDANYAFNNLFKEESDPEESILNAKVGVEYNIAQAPGLKLGAFYQYNKKTTEVEGEADTTASEEVARSGFNIGASYAFSF